MKKLIFIVPLFIFSMVQAQLDRVAGGLGFSSGVDYNYASSGNPAVFGAACFKLQKRLHVVPSASIFFNGQDGSSLQGDVRNNYMFHADVDAQYGIMKENQLSLVGFAGFNLTGIISRVSESTTLENSSALKPGLNLGAGVEMMVNPSYDALVSAKYIVSEFSQFVIHIGVIYHFNSNRRRTW